MMKTILGVPQLIETVKLQKLREVIKEKIKLEIPVITIFIFLFIVSVLEQLQ